MNIASRWMVVLGLAAALAAITPAQHASAQEVQVTGPLAGAPAVRKMRIYRDGRFQLKVGLGFTMQDEFVRHIMIMGQAQYHFVDWLGVAFFGGGSLVGLNTSLTDQITTNGTTTESNLLSLPTARKFGEQVGTIDALFGAQLTFIPLRGKLAMFEALFVDTDFYLFAGIAMAMITERADAVPGQMTAGGICASSLQPGSMSDPSTEACVASQEESSSRMAPAPTFGAGLSLFFNDWASLSLEWRAFPFKWNNSGTDQAGMNASRVEDSNGEFPDGKIDDTDRLRHFNQMMTISAAFYFPVTARISE